MASEERIPFLGDDEECEERKVQLASENDGIQNKSDGSELLGNKQTHETESCIKDESVTDQGGSAVNIIETQNAGGESGSVTNTGSQLASKLVDSNEIGMSASKPVDVTGDKTTDEGNQDTISTGNQNASKVVDSIDNSSEIDISASKPVDITEGTTTDEGNLSTGTKQVKTEKNVESVPSTSSESPSADDKSKESALWYIHVLLVRGLPPREAGNLKQLLNMTLGDLGHRIRPRQKGDKVLYVHFKSEDEMKIAQSLLHNQNFLGYTLNAKVVSNEQQKRKALMIDEDYYPLAKKIKPDPEAHDVKRKQKQGTSMLQFIDGPYGAQLHRKSEDLYMKLQRIAKLLRQHYPKYDRMISKREMKYHGLICILDRFIGCPPDERFAIRCKFSVGIDDETGRLVVGFHAGGGRVNKISSMSHNFPPHVVQAAQVFEDAIQGMEKVSDRDGIVQYKFWHELVIRTNHAKDLMFMVYVQSPQETAEERMKRLHEELKVFFESEDAKKCRITSIYTKVTHTPAYIAQQLTLAVGSPYLEETVLDLKFHLLPSMHFWNNIHAAKMVCKGIGDLLALTKKITVLEVGCGFGLIGLYLSKMAGEVLSVDADHFVSEARKHAELNGVTGCQYFGGKPEEVLPTVATKITCNKACAIVISSSNHSSTCAKAMKELRKIPQVRRVVLVTEMFYSRFSPIMTLSKPTTANDMGYPFFPLRAIPVDTKPSGKGYMLLILMERIGLFSLLKTPGPPHEKSGKTKEFRGPGRAAAGMWRPYEVEAEYTELLLRGTGYT